MMEESPAEDVVALSVMQEFPLLSGWEGFTYWTGFIGHGQGKLLRIALSLPNFPSCGGLSVEGDDDGVQVLENFMKQISSEGLSSLSLIKYLRELQKYLSNLDVIDHEKTSKLNASFFVTILNELELIGTENVSLISQDFTEISLKYMDSMRNTHVIDLSVPPDYPKSSTRVEADLPSAESSGRWPKKISDIFTLFKSDIDKYVTFWQAMDELDTQVKVIEPADPKRRDIHRRILLNQNVVLNIVFNPDCPQAFPPGIKFSGPEKAVLELETRLDRRCRDWNESKTILENLEDILQVEFPLKSSENNEDENLESVCVICYAYEFDGTVPETICDCGSIYHDRCLSDLLINDLSEKARRLCIDCPVCGLELKVSKTSSKLTW